MSRLYDRCKAAGILPYSWDPIIVDGTNVAHYMFMGTPQEYWKYQKDFPNCVPPFRHMWIEFRAPAKIVSEEFGTVPWGERPPTWAWWIHAYDRRGEDVSRFPSVPEEARWVISGGMYSEYTKWRPANNRTVENLVVNGDGQVIPWDSKSEVLLAMPEERRPRDPQHQQQLVDMYSTFFQPALLTICMMNCKNVKMVESDPATRHTGKKQKNRLSRYYTLEIEPIKRVLRQAAPAAKGLTDIQRALHICRGHFKDFRESGLFGKYHGVYWWDAQVRGNKDSGEVRKDYEVEVGYERA